MNQIYSIINTLANYKIMQKCAILLPFVSIQAISQQWKLSLPDPEIEVDGQENYPVLRPFVQ